MSLDLISVDRSSHADPTDFLALLRTRRERPRQRAAECDQQFALGKDAREGEGRSKGRTPSERIALV
jgi:hypothetical protein